MMTTKTNDNSGGTGYSAGNDFTIKPLTTTVDIKLVRRLMATWHTNGLTDSNIRKILLLYFGEPAWMNLDKVYDRNMFGQIAKGMNFHCRHSFIEAILKSTGFGFIWKNKRCCHTEQNLMAFYSPIWHVAKEDEVKNEQISNENSDENEQVSNGNSNENVQNGVGYYYYNNIYIKKNIKKNDSNNVSRSRFAQNGNPGNQFSPEQKVRIEAAVKSLFNYIATDQDAYTNIVESINETTLKLMPELYIDEKAACPTTLATRQFFNTHLYPYLLEHSERMMKIPTLLGQSCWIRNLLKMDFMQKKIAAAVSDTRLYMMQHAAEMIRQNRPISAYEYQDKATEQRFYDVRNKDGTIKQIRIPNEAPPRPSDSAAWNKFAKKWNQ